MSDIPPKDPLAPIARPHKTVSESLLNEKVWDEDSLGLYACLMRKFSGIDVSLLCSSVLVSVSPSASSSRYFSSSDGPGPLGLASASALEGHGRSVILYVWSRLLGIETLSFRYLFNVSRYHADRFHVVL